MASPRGPVRYHWGGGVARMTRRTRTSTNIFRARIETLVREQGIERQMRQYGVTRRTVQRWVAGESTPSQARRESIRRRGLTAGAPQAQQIRVRGRFSQEGTIARGGSLNAVAAINRRMRRVRDAEIRAARRAGDQRRMRMARALPTRMTRDEASAIAIRRERLMSEEPGRVGPSGEIQIGGDIVGEPIDEEYEGERGYDYWDEIDDYDVDDWAAWRADYAEATGT